MTNPSPFDIERSRAYWRHAPSGAGKHDTSVLASAADGDLLATWNAAFRSRFGGYPEEMTFLRTLAPTIAGQRVLSIGSGLGLHEVYYRSKGAAITCADIVPTNLEVIRRVASLTGAGEIETILLDDPAKFPTSTFDVVFIYGSLMAMPTPDQRTMLAKAARVLAPGGRIVLMLYTWEFARRTCGWESKDEFDPLMFARASDPTVGDEACPWSDWHDDDKLLALAEPGFAVTRRQLWNDDVYVWYELRRTSSSAPEPFFTEEQHYGGRIVQALDASEFAADAATLTVASGRHAFVTGEAPFAYAAVSAEHRLPDGSGANALDVQLTLDSGGVSIGLLDCQRGAFAATAVVVVPGRARLRLLPRELPRDYRVIVSNHQASGRPGASRFTVHSAALVAADVVEPPGSTAGGRRA